MTDRMVNLRTNYPGIPAEKELFANFLSEYLPSDDALRSGTFLSPHNALIVPASFINIPQQWLADNSQVLSCSNGTQAIFLLLLSMQREISTIGVEDYTYSGFKTAAEQLNYQLESLACDDEGILPQALKAAVDKGIRLFYVQPTIHNPTCRVMGESRRKEIASILRNSDALLIEDDAYRFLHPSPPVTFLEMMPRQTIHIFSLSKPYNPFINSCFIVYPKDALASLPRLAEHAGAAPSAVSKHLMLYLAQHSRLKELVKKKQQRARELQVMMLPLLDGLRYQTFETSFHIWITLPNNHCSQKIAMQLKDKNILVNGSHEYAVGKHEGYIRIAMSAERDMDVLKNAFLTVRDLLLS